MDPEYRSLNHLVPLSPGPERVLSTNLPEIVCVLLIRYANNSASLRLPPKLRDRTAGLAWNAVREPDRFEVALILKEGPLSRCILVFSASPTRSSEFVFQLVGGYQPRPTKMYGVLEDWKARRVADEVRSTVVDILKFLVAQIRQRSGPELRQSERRPLQGSARIRVGNRSWLGQFVNASQGGVGVAIPIEEAVIQQHVQYFAGQSDASLEALEPRLDRQIPVKIRHTSAVRGGVVLGLQADNPGDIAPLVRRAFEAS